MVPEFIFISPGHRNWPRAAVAGAGVACSVGLTYFVSTLAWEVKSYRHAKPEQASLAPYPHSDQPRDWMEVCFWILVWIE